MARSKEDLELALKKLEGVYRTTPNEEQRLRVYRQIQSIKRMLADIEAGKEPGAEDEIVIDLDDMPTPSQALAPGQPASPAAAPQPPPPPQPRYESLEGVPIRPVHSLCNNDDVNFLSSMLTEFEDEYWGAVSDYHLKLDYNHSNKRDLFFDKLENNKRLLKELAKIYDQIEHTPRPEFKAQLQSMATKQERTFLVEAVSFFNSLLEFLSLLVEDYENRGNIILNPDEEVRFGKLYGEKKLSGLKVIDAVRRTVKFLAEVLDFVNLPNLYKRNT